MSNILVPVLLAGGVGERFWPLSRVQRPKQLLTLVGHRTMLEETLERIRPLARDKVRPLIVTSAAIAGPIRTALKGLFACDLLVEPQGRNTAPAVALAAMWVERRYGPSVMCVLTADHAISPAADFISALRYAAEVAQRWKKLVVFGIKPTRPETGYGYIEMGNLVERRGNRKAFEVRRFVEKPPASIARKFCRSRRYLWNSGMFVWRTDVILEEFQRYVPSLYRQARAAACAGFSREALRRYYGSCLCDSIDYAIMEHSRRVAVVVGGFQWDDVGSWDAVSRVRKVNERGTVAVGEQVFERNCRDSIIVNDSTIAVAALGLTGVVVAVTEDAILVSSRTDLPHLKAHLAEMKRDRRFPRTLF